MVDTVDTGTRMYLIMEDNNRVTHSVLDREDFVSILYCSLMCTLPTVYMILINSVCSLCGFMVDKLLDLNVMLYHS